jgi:hypothetical protein
LEVAGDRDGERNGGSFYLALKDDAIVLIP